MEPKKITKQKADHSRKSSRARRWERRKVKKIRRRKGHKCKSKRLEEEYQVACYK